MPVFVRSRSAAGWPPGSGRDRLCAGFPHEQQRRACRSVGSGSVGVGRFRCRQRQGGRGVHRTAWGMRVRVGVVHRGTGCTAGRWVLVFRRGLGDKPETRPDRRVRYLAGGCFLVLIAVTACGSEVCSHLAMTPDRMGQVHGVLSVACLVEGRGVSTPAGHLGDRLPSFQDMPDVFRSNRRGVILPPGWTGGTSRRPRCSATLVVLRLRPVGETADAGCN